MTDTLSSTTCNDALPNLTEGSPTYNNVVAMICSVINSNSQVVQREVERWLTWMVDGGHRPKAERCIVFAYGHNGIRLAQESLCAVLDRHYPAIDFDNTAHFALVERATRPLPKTALANELAAS